MKTLILDGLFVYKDLPKSFDGARSIDIILEKAKANDIDRFILLQNGKISNIPEGIKNVILNDFSIKDIIEAIDKESKNSNEVIVYNAASPFYDPDFANKMLETHKKFIADYTYAIGYPDGMLPVILRKDIIKEFIPLIENDNQMKKDYLFYALSKDINSFDIETFLSEDDLRIFRISFGMDDAGEELITQQVYNEFKKNFNTEKITEYLAKNSDKLFTTVYLVTLELTNFSKINSIYYPKINEDKKELDFNLIKNGIDSLKQINSKARIILGGIGEPLEHSQFFEIVKYITDNDFNLIIETTCPDLDNDFIAKLDNFKKDKIIFVIKQDAYFEETYKLIHPEGNFSSLSEIIKKVNEMGFKVYRQIVRMNENEVEIEKFIRNKEMDDIIIRKYTTFCDVQEDKKVVDLAPLERIPCFHLRREIFVRSDGVVPACMYSRYKNFKLGDLKKDNLLDVIDNLKDSYTKNSQKKYMDFCVNCNDYYIFNF